MKPKIVFLVLLNLTVTTNAFATPESMHEAKPGSPEFERLKTLVGTWRGTATHEEGAAPEEAAIEYQLTSGGSVLVETLFPETPHEMVSVYHDDESGKLTMTHYCAMGNQPKLDLKSSEGGTLVLDFSPSNTIAETDPHMHALTLAFKDDALTQTWISRQPGKPDGVTTIVVKKA